MTIVKINLHKVHAERSLDAKGGQVKINNTASVKNVESLDFAAEGKSGAKFTFEFNCDYQPDLGMINVAGQVLFVDTDEVIKNLLEQWEKEKKVPNEVMERIVNAVLHKGNIQAIKISEEVNLPSPLPLPKVKKQA